MKIATLLFTYNRSHHTEQVISSLKKNTVLPQKLLVFQDGLKPGQDDCEWKKVNSLIRSIDWCEREIIVAEYNKGLATSIVDGINHAFKEHDAVIVLEDDCVSASGFISFMQQCFEKYKDNKKVYSVSGYSWPFTLKKTKYDVYGCGRISSWGWGTWKDRWNSFEKDYELVRKMKQGKNTSKNFAMWGRDLEDMLVSNVRGNIDSWAVFWALNVISREGICINPYQSLIRNIGTDGSGTHCGSTDQFDVELEDNEKGEISLPDEIGFSDETIEDFLSLYGGYTAFYQDDESKENILVYGAGGFFFNNEKAINDRYNIKAFIDQNKRGWLAGRKVIQIEEITKYEYQGILIMLQNVQECIKVVKNLIAQGVSYKQIMLGHSFFGSYSKSIDTISVLPDGCLNVTIGEISRVIHSVNEFEDFCK